MAIKPRRIYEVAKDFRVSSQALVKVLKELGFAPKSHMSVATPEMIYEAARKGIKFVKFIPVGTSYGASRGLRLDDFDSLFKIFVAIEDAGLHLLVHAELISSHSGTEIHLIDREEAAIPIIDRYHKLFSGMKITVEHASTAKMINFIRSCSGNVRATLTPQHALMTYDDVFDPCDNMINPYNYC